MRELNTHQRILVETQDLLQRVGFFGLSLQDLANRIQIRKPSLYAHYESKESLGVYALQAYEREFEEWANGISADSPEMKLSKFFQRLEQYLIAGKVCPNSALALEADRLPEEMRKAYQNFVQLQVKWLEQVIARGQELGVFKRQSGASEIARSLFRQSIGAQLTARSMGSLEWFYQTNEEISRALSASISSFTTETVVHN